MRQRSVGVGGHSAYITAKGRQELRRSQVIIGDERAKSPLKIVPKGLRSFDAEDKDFFLELLPGPRRGDGLPESVHFWKVRIEEMDPDKTFRVGYIFGPSGCGKSSLVKAGLLPRLSKPIIPIYVEATGEETEARLLRGLRKHEPRPARRPRSPHRSGRCEGENPGGIKQDPARDRPVRAVVSCERGRTGDGTRQGFI